MAIFLYFNWYHRVSPGNIKTSQYHDRYDTNIKQVSGDIEKALPGLAMQYIVHEYHHSKNDFYIFLLISQSIFWYHKNNLIPIPIWYLTLNKYLVILRRQYRNLQIAYLAIKIFFQWLKFFIPTKINFKYFFLASFHSVEESNNSGASPIKPFYNCIELVYL